MGREKMSWDRLPVKHDKIMRYVLSLYVQVRLELLGRQLNMTDSHDRC